MVTVYKFKLIEMQQLVVLCCFLLLTTSSFAQKVDWINAPLNPTLDYADLKHLNIKGDVFQYNTLNFAKDGQVMFGNKHNKNIQIKKDAAGNIIEQTDELARVTKYLYDAKSNLTQVSTKYTKINYTYDGNNRIIKKENIDDRGDVQITLYNYKKQKNLLMVTESESQSDGNVIETDKHFKNGLEIYRKREGLPSLTITYQFDHKGNWIKQTEIDSETKKATRSALKREIIYYSDYEKGTSAISVVTEKLSAYYALLVPNAYINSGKYYAYYNKFGDDYVFYDVFSKTYYIGRGAYSKTVSDGQKHPVQLLLIGYNIILLYHKDKNIISFIEDGVDISGMKYYNFYDHIMARNSVTGQSMLFGPFSDVSSSRTHAFSGINLLDKRNTVGYIVRQSTKEVLIIDQSELVTNAKYFGLTADNSVVLAVNNNPKYVLSSFKYSSNLTFMPARYFDPAKDKIISPKQ